MQAGRQRRMREGGRGAGRWADDMERGQTMGNRGRMVGNGGRHRESWGGRWEQRGGRGGRTSASEFFPTLTLIC